MNNIRGIVIDASHGGEDLGVTGNGIVEKDFSLLISKYIYDKLKNLGYNVSLSRTTDETLNNTDRINRILDFYGDDNVIIISNHLSDTGENVEIIYALRNSSLLSNYLLEAMKNEGITVEKAYQRRLPSDTAQDYYFIHRETLNAIPILISYGNIMNDNEAKDLQNYQKYGDAVVNGIINYINNISTSEYTVKRGDSLYSIATKYGTSVAKLKELNNLSSNILQIGQKLKIPQVSEQLPADASEYIVKRGDSLYSIATKYGTSVAKLKELNNLSSNILQIGQKLKIPVEISTDASEYIVKRGDSLYSIATKYGTSVAKLKELNNLSSNVLQIGQKLKIPVEISTDVIEYIVKRGDSLYSIAQKYNTTVLKIMNLNNLKTNLLSINQKLKIPFNN